MLICIIGTQCSGKTTVKQYLQALGFQEIIYHSRKSIATPQARKRAIISAASEKMEKDYEYNDFNQLLSFATQNWREHFVCTSLRDLGMLRTCAQRPFFVLLSVDAPVLTRWKRSKEKHPTNAVSLEQFIQDSDKERFGLGNGDHDPLNDILQAISHVSITNDFSQIAPLHNHLESLALTNPERTRPGWDDYFMLLASLASLRCNCMKRRVGAVLVRNKRVVSTGYNGTPRGLLNCNEGGCKRCNGTAKSGEAYDSCLCLHAEENALLEAGRDRVGEKSTLYCNTCPCLRCTIKIVQSGVTEVVYNKSYSMDEASANIFKEAGVILRQHSPPRDYPI